MTGARLLSYIRVSDMGERDEDSESTQTIRQQREANQAIAKLSNATIAGEVLALNASGGKAWPEPKLAEAIERVEAGGFDGIVVYDLSRWGRHLDALKVIERWATEDKTFLSAHDKFDATTPGGRVTLRMMMVIATYHWELLRDRLMESQLGAFKRGAYIARTPWGYLRVTDGPRVGCLDIDPVAAPLVTEAFEVAAGDGLHAACSYLREVAPGRRWRTDDARRVLRNRAYLGEAKLGDRVVKDAHPALTSLATFAAAQTEPRDRRRNGDYLLSGVATCGKCGEPMVGALQTVRDKPYRRMRCSNPACRGGSSISADKLESYVHTVIKTEIDRHGGGAFAALTHGDVQAAERALAEAEAERTSFARDVAFLRALGPEAARANAEALSAEVKRAQEAFQALASQVTRAAQVPASGELDDPVKLLRAVTAGVDAIVVRPGRGAVEDRVMIRFHHFNDAAGTFAA